jgi:hypothetical protein
MNNETIPLSLESLIAKFPFPWRAEEYYDKGWAILDANNVEVMYCASFTGDGAVIGLEYEHAVSIVELLNNIMDCSNELNDTIEKFKRDQCRHDWIPMDNKVITGGHICMKCMALKPE